MLFFSCSHLREIPPPLGHQEMVHVLIEIHLLDAKVEKLKIYPYDSIPVVYKHYEKLLFEDLSTTKEDYEESYDYYLNHPKDFLKIYEEVVDSLLQRDKTTP